MTWGLVRRSCAVLLAAVSIGMGGAEAFAQDAPGTSATPVAPVPAHSTQVEVYATEQTSDLTFRISSADGSLVKMGPNATWTLSSIGTKLYFRDSLALPQTYSSPWLWDEPYGQHTLTIDAGPEFEVWSQTITVDQPAQVIDLVLQPSATAPQAGFVTFDISSANPALSRVPVNTQIQLFNAQGVRVHSGYLRGTLPQSWSAPSFASQELPFGEYTLLITPPNTFQTYRATFTLDEVYERFDVQLVPVHAVTISAATFDGGSAEGATVSVADASGADVASGVIDFGNRFNAGALPEGAYTVSIDAQSAGLPYMNGSVAFTVSGGAVNVAVPLNDFPAGGTVSGVVTNAGTGAAIPGASVVVVDSRGNVAAGSSGADGSFGVSGLVQGIEQVITVTAPGYEPVTLTHTFPLTTEPQTTEFPVGLRPIAQLKKAIVITVDPGAVGAGASVSVPEGSTWTLTNEQSGDVYTGSFSGTVPQMITLSDAIGSGTYTVEVDAGPGFKPYTGTVTLRGSDDPVYIELVPVAAE